MAKKLDFTTLAIIGAGAYLLTKKADPKVAGIAGANYSTTPEIVIGKLANAASLQSLVPAVKLRISRGKMVPTDKITNSGISADIFRKFITKNQIQTQEFFCIAYLNQANKVLGVYTTGMGAINAVIADVRLILAGALSMGATGLILCHNHPSGNLNPSQADIDFTQRIKVAAKTHEIMVLDHIILTGDAYYSFADEIGIGKAKAGFEFNTNDELVEYMQSLQLAKQRKDFVTYSKN